MHGADGTPTIDCFDISPPRSGTTWLSWCLDAHPSVSVLRPEHPGPYKAPAIFPNTRDLPFVGLLSDYRQRLGHARPGDVLVDASTYQLLDAERAASPVLDHNPEVRLLVVLRHPIERLFDHYQAARRTEDPLIVPTRFEDALEVPAFLDSSRYARHLARWHEHFHPDHIHVVLDTDLRHEPELVLESAYGFLGVNRRFRPDGTLSAEDAFRAARPRRRRLPEAYRSILRRDRRRQETLHPETAERLAELLAPEIDRLEKMLGRDLETWRQVGAVDTQRAAPVDRPVVDV